MPSQTRIINKINTILSANRGIQVRLNTGGVCAGLAAVFVKCTLEGRKEKFLESLDQIVNLPDDYKLGTNKELDQFIIDVEKAYMPDENINRYIAQSDIEEAIKVNGRKPRNEYNIGLITSEENWGMILDGIINQKRSVMIHSPTHAVAIHFVNGKIVLYDPNADQIEEFDHAIDAIKRIQQCMFYTKKPFGLNMRVFADPTDDLEPDYPNKAEIHDIVFPDRKHVKEKFKFDNDEFDSAFFATGARDDETLDLLFERKAVENIPNIGGVYSNKRLINHLCNLEATSDNNRWLLLEAIGGFLLNGAPTDIKRLVNKYKNDYSTGRDLNILKTEVVEPVVKSLFVRQNSRLKQKEDHTSLLKLMKEMNLEFQYPREYRQLSLLTAENSDTPENNIKTVIQSWGHLSLQEILEQIRVAALFNRPFLVKNLVDHLQTAYPSWKSQQIERYNLIDKQLICSGAPEVISQLLTKGFKIDIKLVQDIFDRNDVRLFEKCLPHIGNRNNPEKSLPFAQLPQRGERCDLFANVEGLSYLKVFIFLGKMDLIQENWNDSASKVAIQEALVFAYRCQNSNFIKFLEDIKNIQLLKVNVKILMQEAFKNKSLPLLTTLSRTYNIFSPSIADDDNFASIIDLCDDAGDFSLLTKNWDKITPERKIALLEMAVEDAAESPQFLSLLFWLASNDTQLCLFYIKETIEDLKLPKEKNTLSLLERLASLLPRAATIENIKLPEDFAPYTLQVGSINLLRVTQQDHNFTLDKVFKSLSDTSKAVKEKAIISVLENNSELLKDPNLIYGLAFDKCYDAIAYLLTSGKIKLNEKQYEFLLNRVFDTAGTRANTISDEKLKLITYLLESPFSTSKTFIDFVGMNEIKILNELKRLGNAKPILLLFSNPELNLPNNFELLRGTSLDEVFKTACEQMNLSIVDALLAFPDRFSPNFSVNDHIQKMLNKLGRKDELYNKLYEEKCAGIYSYVLKNEIMQTIFERSELLQAMPANANNFELASQLIDEIMPINFSFLYRALREGHFDMIDTIFENVPQLQSPSMLA
ncbi:MAG: hypothetical protein QXN55_07875, partial [Candidatus Nitrosotenuis sp.]